MPEFDLQRFIAAQDTDFDRALGEIEAGRKCSHWMWYIFPQARGLGFSSTSRQYAIDSVDEAKAFLAHPLLGDRYRQIVEAVWHQVVEGGVTVHDLFGSPDDAKLVSSLTLFCGVARQLDSNLPELAAFIARAEAILRAAYNQELTKCSTTENFIANRSVTDN